jgi:hypothetical protein
MKLHGTWLTTLLGLMALCAAGMFALACNDDDDDDTADSTPAASASPTAAASSGAEAEIEETINAAVAAWNGKDADAFLVLFTDKALSDLFGQGEPVTREEAAAALPDLIGDPPIELRDLTVEADGAAGTAVMVRVMEPFLEQVEMAMVEQDGAWRIDGEDYVDVADVPEGTTMVPVDVSEFAFGVVTDDLIAANASGPVGFTVSNIGEQTHHFALAKVPADGDITEMLMSEAEVPGLEFAGFTDEIAPDESNSAFVFVAPMEPGRYAMVCFLPDTTEGPEGTPHAFKGMVQEFTIP